MSWKTKVNRQFSSVFFIWLAGMVFSYVLSAVPISIASKSLPPHLISAVYGWGMVVVVFLSRYLLKEKLYGSDITYSIVIIGCIFLLGTFRIGEAGMPPENMGRIYKLLLIPFILLIPVFFKFTGNKQKTILLSIFSGFMGGLTVVFLNILIRQNGYSIAGIASSPCFYIYMISGVASVIAKQAAYRFGDVIMIAPLQTSFSMIYPLLCTYLLYNSSIFPAQVILVAFIAASCWGIQLKR